MRAAKLPDPPTAVNILTLLLESERCAIRSWSAICDMTFGKDPRTYDMAARILNEEIEHEAWFIELLAHERDGKSIPLGTLPPRRAGRSALQQEPWIL